MSTTNNSARGPLARPTPQGKSNKDRKVMIRRDRDRDHEALKAEPIQLHQHIQGMILDPFLVVYS
ncbi:hypothetical protein GcM3_020034 [Golovinomyces cichoracearum]|uniref:Uncharacterized protein n=1 Tax=Golovinomyces cichoracearum TaxID=62708 RepID=A0A420J7P3_9PEZI|nr:hypothetical protein GcM3_020034 [Golovinomyces cichoracearum]